ncbi:hypothetical protein BDV96DRAFT_677288 [Lophiotrema nucula]|uniref:Uncharacterized protein n=1 Tax=Lophiotrema nucula TaxID=690887 RepID=A0A6A5YGY7_9PLEO|nr:hypothetical protein BDV96DRAFT_677288 [Lophiotrema nucula]
MKGRECGGHGGGPGISLRSGKKEVGEGGIDVALLNASGISPSYEKSQEGWEMAVQVHVLSTALMAADLLPLLRQAGEKTDEPSHTQPYNLCEHHRTR